MDVTILFMDSIIYIYALKDPLTNKIRYIGKTNNTKRRLYQHLTYGKKYKIDTHLYRWINKLLNKSLKPVMEILEIVDIDYWIEAEQAWIEYAQWCGWPLTNLTPGGETSTRALKNALKTQCPKGHNYSLGNTYIHPDGRRQCVECSRMITRSEKHRAKSRISSSNRRKKEEELKKEQLKSLVNNYDLDIITRLKAKRELINYTQAEIAFYLGVSERTVFRWENRQTKPSLQFQVHWEKILNDLPERDFTRKKQIIK